MALDPALELRELDAILGSTDDPDTKRARIAQLYQEPVAANDPSAGIPMQATAQADPMAAVRQQRDADIQQQTATDAAQPLTPLQPYEPSGFEQAAKISTDTPPGAERVAPGQAGMGQLARDMGLVVTQQDPTAAPPPEPRMGTTTVEPAPIRPKPARVGGLGQPGVAPWLAKEMGGQENFYGRPDPIGTPVTKPENAAYRSLEEEQLAQTREQGEAERRAILAGAQAEVAAVEQGQVVDAELAKREMERQRQLEKMETEYGDMLAEADAEPIDSERLWNNKSTGEKILSKIALFIGTIGGAGLGDPKLMMNKMDADVERDMAAQKANKGFQLHKLAAKGSLYDMAKGRFASEQAVDQAMRETAWRKIDSQLKQFHTVAQDPARKAALEQLMAQTEGKIVDSERQRRLLNEADILARARAAAANSAGARNAKLEKDPKYVPGIGLARTDADAKELREELANYMMAKKNFGRARVLGKKASSGAGAFGYGTDEYHEADALTSQLVTGVAKSYGGVVTASDEERAKKEMPDLTAYGKGWETRLDAAERKVETNFRSRVRAKIQGAVNEPEIIREE